jgi:glycosyltransferase involved in cell wall biosynthesis
VKTAVSLRGDSPGQGTLFGAAGADGPELSVVVPMYNEEDSVLPLYRAVMDVLDRLEAPSELILVDDGSRDGTFARLRAVAESDRRVRAVRFRRNFGQTPAMSAGIALARGRVIVTMDGDLQNDPADIPEFLAKIGEGYDIVVGWRHNRQDKLVSRKIPSRIANWLIGKVTGVPIKDNGCSLKAYRAEIVKNVPLYSEMHRFIPAMLSLTGAQIAEIKVRHHARRFGSSKYGLSRIYKVLMDLLTIKTLVSFCSRSLVWFAMGAGLLFTIGAGAFAAALYRHAADDAQPLVVLFGVSLVFGSGGIFLLLCGLLTELVVSTAEFRTERLPRLTVRDLAPVDVKG